MPDIDVLDSLEEIDSATERARECSDHLWRLASDRSVAADYAFELCQALRRVQDETAGLRSALSGGKDNVIDLVDGASRLIDRLEQGGGRKP